MCTIRFTAHAINSRETDLSWGLRGGAGHWRCWYALSGTRLIAQLEITTSVVLSAIGKCSISPRRIRHSRCRYCGRCRASPQPKNRVLPAAPVVASAERWTWGNRRRSNEGPELLPGRSPLTREMLQNDERNPQVLMSHKFRHCTNTFRMFLAFSALLSIVVSSNIAMAQPRCNLDNHCACGTDGHCVDNSQHYSCYCVCAPTLCTVDNELKAEWKDLLPTEEFYGIKGRRE